jgi:hypothetical protein
MATHDFVYQTFVIYIFLKSLVFFPLVWIACVFWWSERKSRAADTSTTSNLEASLPQQMLTSEPLAQ